MNWIDKLIEQAEEAQKAYEAKCTVYNAEVDAELEELTVIERHDLIPGMPVDAAQRAVLRSQVRLLRKQWEALRME